MRAGLVDSDSVTSIREISAAVAAFGQFVSGRVDGQGRIVDMNGDGRVDILDILAIASNFGQTSPIPWPGIKASTPPLLPPNDPIISNGPK